MISTVFFSLKLAGSARVTCPTSAIKFASRCLSSCKSSSSSSSNNNSGSGSSDSNVSVRSTAASGSMVYESERAVHEYLLTHYGSPTDQMPYDFGPRVAVDLPKRCADICARHITKTNGKSRALDVGCATGGQSFHLARHFDEVVGMDFSKHFVDASNEMKEKGEKTYKILKTGTIFQTMTAKVDPSIDRKRASFYQGDACNLDKKLGKFNLILASNLLCRLPKPRDFIKAVPEFLQPGGVLVMISPFSWLEEYTPKSEWFGGQYDDKGVERDSNKEFQAYMKAQAPSMKLVATEEVPFLIREHLRKFQYGVSQCTIWKKEA